jgi:hypothetical protein
LEGALVEKILRWRPTILPLRRKQKVNKKIAVAVVLILLAIITYYCYIRYVRHPSPQPPVEITGLKIGGEVAQAQARNGSYTEISFRLKNNDGKNHSLIVIFELTTQGIHHVSIVTAKDQPLPRSDTTFRYSRFIYATDPYLDQRVYAWSHLKGLAEAAVEIKIYLLVDGKLTGEKQTVTLIISR